MTYIYHTITWYLPLQAALRRLGCYIPQMEIHTGLYCRFQQIHFSDTGQQNGSQVRIPLKVNYLKEKRESCFPWQFQDMTLLSYIKLLKLSEARILMS